MAYDVRVFVDEQSFWQMKSDEEFINHIINLLKLVNKIDRNKVYLKLCRSDTFEGQSLKLGKTVSQTINEVLPRDIRRRLKQQLYEYSNEVWNEKRLHNSEDYYEFDGECVTDYSLAESAEAVAQNVKGTLAFINNKQENNCVAIVEKEESLQIEVPTLDENLDFNAWLEVQYDISLFNYDYDSTTPPTDQQTYLRERNQYVRTVYNNQGRAVYQCNITRYYHTVDNLHHGRKAHVEVWDRYGIYIGEADLLGNINREIKPEKKKEKNNPCWL